MRSVERAHGTLGETNLVSTGSKWLEEHPTDGTRVLYPLQLAGQPQSAEGDRAEPTNGREPHESRPVGNVHRFGGHGVERPGAAERCQIGEHLLRVFDKRREVDGENVNVEGEDALEEACGQPVSDNGLFEMSRA